MKVIVGRQKYCLKNNHPFAQAIVALARMYPGASGSLPERNDIKQLWRELSEGHRTLLAEVARRPGGISQSDLQSLLDVDWQGLRGVHNGLARICEGLGLQKPVRSAGYNSQNRQYLMDPDVAATILKLCM